MLAVSPKMGLAKGRKRKSQVKLRQHGQPLPILATGIDKQPAAAGTTLCHFEHASCHIT